METTQQASEPPIKTPDFGEPWKAFGIINIDSAKRQNMAQAICPLVRDRIVACVNATAGMADPAREIQAMRDAIQEAHTALNCDALWAFDEMAPSELEARWRDGRGSLTSGPNNCGAFFSKRKAALAKLQPFLPKP
jgi:hypothetical protein